mgnify:CR=1 FL=1
MTIIYIYWNVSIIDKVYRKNHLNLEQTLLTLLYFMYDYDEARIQLLVDHDQLMEEVNVTPKHFPYEYKFYREFTWQFKK